jgi:hypothetical protein
MPRRAVFTFSTGEISGIRLDERSRARRVIMLVVARGLKRYWLMNRRMCLVSLRPTLAKRYEYAVRVKDLGHELLTLARREVDATVWRSGYRAKRFDSVSS